MKFNLSKLLYPVFVLLFIGFSSCKDDVIVRPDDNEIRMDPNGFYLGLTLQLDKDAKTRAGDSDIDNYIDTEKKLRILFFNSDGDFIFEAIDRTVMRREDRNGNAEWFVHIPVNYVVDREGNNYDIEALKKQLRENPFKVAVLANWPNKGETNPNGNLQYNGEPDWGYDESIYGSNTKNINNLHHLERDNNYYDDTREDRPTQIDVYDFIMDGDKMGVKTDWVKSRMLEDRGVVLTSTTDAIDWIRKNWTPTKAANDNKSIYRHYQYLWYLWDFDAAARNSNTIGDIPTERGDEWVVCYNANKRMYSWLNASAATTNLGALIDNTVEATLNFTNGRSARRVTMNGKYVVRLPSGTENLGVFFFETPKAGTLVIKYGASNNGVNSTLRLERSDDDGGDKSNKSFSTSSNAMQTAEWDINLTGKSQTVKIYCSLGSIDIYSIEYVQGKYLYDSDREGVLPDAEHPIPMYGVQDYNALTDWLPGTTFDLSESTGRNITLIRSLARVEVYIPVGMGKPSHIYMRSANRTARCEPVDVMNPTDKIWEGYTHQSVSQGDCEWYTIQKYGSCYENGTEPKDKSLIGYYTNWLSWFYGTWGNWGWNFTGHNLYESSAVVVPSESSGGKYPQLFNSSIDRSDYAHMIDAGIDGSYYKYILYMPDRNITDPNYPGIHTSAAKVPHVEYRFPDQSEAGLDDNQCYRIYFTDYATNKAVSGLESFKGTANTDVTVNGDNYESQYEKVASNLNKHWPIMRNHVYKFYITGTRAIGGTAVMSEVTTRGGVKVHADK